MRFFSRWVSIRARAFEAHGYVCKLCDAPAKVIHHFDYTQANLSGTDLLQLVPLCHGCHQKVEVNYRGEKRTLEESQQKFLLYTRRKPITLLKKRAHKKKLKRAARKATRKTRLRQQQ